MRSLKFAHLISLTAGLLSIGALPVLAQSSSSSSSSSSSAASKCEAPAPLPPQFSGFDAALKQTASLTPDIAPTLSLESAYSLTLSPALGLAYITAPKKPPEDGRYAGFATFTIVKEGAYSVAVSHSVWIDVYAGTDVINPASFGRVECSGIHKVVNFALKPGTYMLQLSNSPVPAVTVMIAPKP